MVTYKIYMSIGSRNVAFDYSMKSLKSYWDNLVIVDCTKGGSLPYPVEVIVPPEDRFNNISKISNFMFDDAIKRNLDVLFMVVADIMVYPGVIEDMLGTAGWDVYYKGPWLIAVKIEVAKKVRYDERIVFYYSDIDWRYGCFDAGFTVKDCNCGGYSNIMEFSATLPGERCCKFVEEDCGVLHTGPIFNCQTVDNLSDEDRVKFREQKMTDCKTFVLKWHGVIPRIIDI